MTKSYKTTLALSVIAATALAFVIAPALIQSASADAIPKTRNECTQGPPREECPGESEKNNPNRDEVCVARNNGQLKNCPDGEGVIAER
jgi:hypothetical protein